MKKIAFLLSLFCPMILRATEHTCDNLFKDYPTTNQLLKQIDIIGLTINDVIYYAIVEAEKKFQNNEIDVQKLSAVKKAFASDLKQCFTALNVKVCNIMQGIFYERKQYYLGNNKQKPVFFDEEIFKEIRPLIINKNMIDKYSQQDDEFCYFGAEADPLIMNQLIYEHTILTAHGTKVQKNSRSLLKGIIGRTLGSGFFIDDTLYRRTSPFAINFAQEEIPYAVPQTSEAHIEYFKRAFKPCWYGDFELKELSGELQKRVAAFLLCLNHWKKKSKLIFPRPLLCACILKPLAKYENAQRIRPILVEDIERFKEGKLSEKAKSQEEIISGVFEFINGGGFLKWFDQEALR